MAKICWQMIVFNSDYVLDECIEAALSFGPIVATEGPVKYWKDLGYATSTDATNLVLKAHNIPTVHGQFSEKDEMVNASVRLIPDDTEFVWVLDSDEVWDAAAVRRVVAALDTEAFDSASFHAWSYYGGFERVMGGFEENYETHRIQRWYRGARWKTHRPPTVISPAGTAWRDNAARHLYGESLGARFFHYSYVWPVQMQKKADYYHDRDPGGTIPDYFSRVYLPWVTGNAEQKRAIEDEFDGVHNWVPERRGPCRTRLAESPHPLQIRQSLPRLKERFRREMVSVSHGK